MNKLIFIQSTSLSGLAGAGSQTVAVDLGNDWRSYGLLAINVKGTAAITTITASASDDGTTNIAPLLSTSGGLVALALGAAGDAASLAMPSGRYVLVAITNGAGAQGAGAAVRITAYPS